MDGRRVLNRLGLQIDVGKAAERAVVARRSLAPELAEDRDPLHHAGGTLVRLDAHHLELVRELRAVEARAAIADGEDRPPLRQHVEARPLQREQQRIAEREARQADRAELHPSGADGHRGQRDHRLDPGLGQQIVADPDAVEQARILGRFGHVEQIAERPPVEQYCPGRQRQAEFGAHRNGLVHVSRRARQGRSARPRARPGRGRRARRDRRRARPGRRRRRTSPPETPAAHGPPASNVPCP